MNRRLQKQTLAYKGIVCRSVISTWLSSNMYKAILWVHFVDFLKWRGQERWDSGGDIHLMFGTEICPACLSCNHVYLQCNFVFAVFLVPVVEGAEVHSLSKCPASWFEAKQLATECKLWFEDLWLWTGSYHIRDRLHDWVCCYSLVPGTWIAPQLFRVHCCNWCMVSWVHIHGAAQPGALIPWERLCATASSHNRGEGANFSLI